MVIRRSDYIGPYRIIGTIKTGQNSKVYTVVDDTEKQRYALKILLSDFKQSSEHITLMKHEFEVGNKLRHPRVIHLIDFRTDKKQSYLVMELFAHPNLKELMSRDAAALQDSLPVILERAAEGVAYLHSQGWIHRDIKPDNFLVSPELETKLIDFALCQRKPGAFAKLFAKKGKVQGTRSYMSPEQIRGQPLDFRADVYSFGCMTFHLLGGNPPYTGTSSSDLLNKHIFDAIPALDTANRRVTPEFAALVRNAMAKKPEARPQSIDEFLTEMRRTPVFRSDAPPGAKRAPKNAG